MTGSFYFIICKGLFCSVLSISLDTYGDKGEVILLRVDLPLIVLFMLVSYSLTDKGELMGENLLLVIV